LRWWWIEVVVVVVMVMAAVVAIMLMFISPTFSYQTCQKLFQRQMCPQQILEFYPADKVNFS